MPIDLGSLDDYVRRYGATDADIFGPSPLFDRLSRAPIRETVTSSADTSDIQVVTSSWVPTGNVYVVTQSAVSFLRDGFSAALSVPSPCPAQPQSVRENPPESKPPLEFPVDRKIRFADG